MLSRLKEEYVQDKMNNVIIESYDLDDDDIRDAFLNGEDPDLYDEEYSFLDDAENDPDVEKLIGQIPTYDGDVDEINLEELTENFVPALEHDMTSEIEVKNHYKRTIMGHNEEIKRLSWEHGSHMTNHNINKGKDDSKADEHRKKAEEVKKKIDDLEEKKRQAQHDRAEALSKARTTM